MKYPHQWLHWFWYIASQQCSLRPSLWITVLPINNTCLTFATDTYRKSPGSHQLFSFIHEANTNKYRAAEGLKCATPGNTIHLHSMVGPRLVHCCSYLRTYSKCLLEMWICKYVQGDHSMYSVVKDFIDDCIISIREGIHQTFHPKLSLSQQTVAMFLVPQPFCEISSNCDIVLHG